VLPCEALLLCLTSSILAHISIANIVVALHFLPWSSLKSLESNKVQWRLTINNKHCFYTCLHCPISQHLCVHLYNKLVNYTLEHMAVFFWNSGTTYSVFNAGVFTFCIFANSYDVDIIIQCFIAHEWLAWPNICIQVKLSATNSNVPSHIHSCCLHCQCQIAFSSNTDNEHLTNKTETGCV